ncbi:hypothetical protein XBKQ1_2790016 [Xenorhabdus bovienii str. kraussei Quebec]|uniref:Uncharacterized protein n=1 Tax=Xenorhabdus bovienii str. kraussei Quebec TaxID=1398203 RepID=A0A077PM38_XENBV|nr:hypothetical protein XBKQ1_2790016 [Xenorhabdus bovienii str. kraussei Quebec]
MQGFLSKQIIITLKNGHKRIIRLKFKMSFGITIQTIDL